MNNANLFYSYVKDNAVDNDSKVNQFFQNSVNIVLKNAINYLNDRNYPISFSLLDSNLKIMLEICFDFKCSNFSDHKDVNCFLINNGTKCIC